MRRARRNQLSWLGLLLVFAPVREPRSWSFPEDHGAHREFQTEWWYYTGHLEDGQGGRYGYELVFFRHHPDPGGNLPAAFAGWQPAEIYPAHFAITDETGRSFVFHQKVERALGGVAGSDSSDLHVWCGDWTLTRRGSAHVLLATTDRLTLSLDLVPLKNPVLHGNGGLSRKGPGEGQASYYYSLTRMATQGLLISGDVTRHVTGTSWMDHEFFSSALDTTLAGWDWFSLQLDDQTEIMLYRLRGKTPESDRLSGTFVFPDGSSRSLGRNDFRIASAKTWKSPATGVTYPAGWSLQVPSLDLTLDIVPTLPDQELDARSSTGVVYWEGSARVSGSRRGTPVTGSGYVELTGYGGSPPLTGLGPGAVPPFGKQ